VGSRKGKKRGGAGLLSLQREAGLLLRNLSSKKERFEQEYRGEKELAPF